MSELDTLTGQFKGTLDGIHTKYTLEEWRYAYREIIYAGAMRILEEFPEIIIGSPPSPSAQPQGQQSPTRGDPALAGGPRSPRIDGERPPYHPNGIGQIVCIALGNCPPPPPKDN
jgi:hypothetical protein